MISIGIDQSFSNTGVCATLNDSILAACVIPTTNDFFKFYPNRYFDFKKTQAYKTGLVDDDMKITKKKSSLSKTELDILKVSQQKRIGYICSILEEFINKIKIENPTEQIVFGLESISMGSKGAIVDLARLLGAIEHHIQILGYCHSIFAPTKIKAWAGKGNFSKEEMIAAVIEEDLTQLKSNLLVDKKGEAIGLNDIVDAYWISKVSADYFS
jgi:hypothetical protein